ncbi:MAG: phosphopantothenoylcysteine decarboxylase, partial [Deltaproteobacteria bacterium]|nr:phosphopantothenoylcysteine decarboxylase [Deltaproteobacteria bacterium]
PLGERRAARAGGGPVLVGFAAETGDAAGQARRKLEAKQVDLIVANDVSRAGAGFEVDTNIVSFVDAQGQEDLPCLPKANVAAALMDRVEALVAARPPRGR